ncbi:hypothetical protein [Amycolatopsis sp. PS_44_ISF1]|uniref:hypothetical protein n=1 Tax=Amycolatopsis sp. PS_44_ISF1 TaxID=2974917 RepID=UPI0028DFEFDA|nr:hypothetical protein [Amycolatopsis sp. PS_44_ISF1]MDT8913137.1 hypothetical protein [Amycolatopsis sp. PS_44_ISF1]
MDDAAVAALLAVPAGLLGADREKFLDLVVGAYPGGDGPELDGFVAQVREREPSFGPAAEAFEENLRAGGLDRHWPDIARAFVDEGGSGARLDQLREELAAETEPEVDPAGDSGGWAAFCTENRGFWLGWDGTEWEAWRAAFAEGAAGAGVGVELEPHLFWMDGLDPAGRVAYLRDTLGFMVGEAASTGSTGGWAAFCVENRGFWLGWDGTEWAAWRAAFAEGAAGAGVGVELEPHLSWMDGLDPAGRVAYLRDTLGFTVGEAVFTEATPSDDARARPSEAEISAALEAAELAVRALPPEQQVIPPEIVSEMFEEFPQAALMDPAELASVMAEAARQIAATPAG